MQALYQRLAPELVPRVLYDTLPATRRKEALAAIEAQTSRVIVCVDMLGEGFDLPTLKVGAFHDSHKSLSPMIQLIGRLARTESPVPIGTASVFVRQDPKHALSPLRFLLREDPDWDTVLSDVTERATARADEISAFEASFDNASADVPVGLLEPKMSAIAFETSVSDWDPHAARGIYGDLILDDSICTSVANDRAWFVIETTEDVRWGDVPSLRATDYVLVLMYLDRDRRLPLRPRFGHPAGLRTPGRGRRRPRSRRSCRRSGGRRRAHPTRRCGLSRGCPVSLPSACH
jgi:hypothetical protein